MALPSSGELGFDDIAAQLRYAQPYGSNCNFNNSQWRGLAQRTVAGSSIGINNFHGKWAGTKMQIWNTANSTYGANWGVIVNQAGYVEGAYNGYTIERKENTVNANGRFNQMQLTAKAAPDPGPPTTRVNLTDDNMIPVASWDVSWTLLSNIWFGSTAQGAANGANYYGTTNGRLMWFTW